MTTGVKFPVIYYKGPPEARVERHRYEEDWQLTERYCPKCGATDAVWKDTSPGDYYLGPEHLCTQCNTSFYLPSGCEDAGLDEQGAQRLKAIRETTE